MRISRSAAVATPATSQLVFENFYHMLRDELLRFTRQQAGPGIDAENIAAEAWKRAYMNWERIREPRPWVYRVVLNLIASARREARRACPDCDPAAAPDARVTWTSASLVPDAPWAERIVDIDRGLQHLPPRQRAAVLLSHRGWTADEIADVIGCTAATARVHLHLGRTRLRTYLAEPAEAAGQETSPGYEGRIA